MNFLKLSSALLLSSLALSTVACSSPTAAQVPVSESQSLFVTGQASVEAPSDELHINLGVEAKALKLDDAMKEATERVNQLHAALLKAGIDKSNIKTGNFSIHQIRERASVARAVQLPEPAPDQTESAIRPAPQPEEEWVNMYQVSNSFDITSQEVEKAGALIQAAVDAGANQSWGMSFDLKDREKHEDEARILAIKNARERAEQMAKAAGVKVGRVLSISDVAAGGGSGPQPKYAMAEMRSANISVAPGQTEVLSQVAVVFEIER